MVQEFKKKKKIEGKNRVLKSAKKLFDVTKNIIGFFEEGTFPSKGNVFKTKEENSQENKLEKIKDDYKNFFKSIEDETKDISYELFKEYFNFEVPHALPKKVYKTKTKKENNQLVKLIKVRWINLKDEIKKISEDEKETEKPDKILKIVEDILIFNREN